MKVPFLDLKLQYQNIKEEIDNTIADVINNSAFIGGENVKNFEKELLNIIQRHPMRQNQIISTFSSTNFKNEEIISRLKKLESKNKIKKSTYNNQIYWSLY